MSTSAGREIHILPNSIDSTIYTILVIPENLRNSQQVFVNPSSVRRSNATFDANAAGPSNWDATVVRPRPSDGTFAIPQQRGNATFARPRLASIDTPRQPNISAVQRMTPRRLSFNSTVSDQNATFAHPRLASIDTPRQPTNSTRNIRPQRLSFNSTVPDQNATFAHPRLASIDTPRQPTNSTRNIRPRRLSFNSTVPDQNATFAHSRLASIDTPRQPTNSTRNIKPRRLSFNSTVPDQNATFAHPRLASIDTPRQPTNSTRNIRPRRLSFNSTVPDQNATFAYPRLASIDTPRQPTNSTRNIRPRRLSFNSTVPDQNATFAHPRLASIDTPRQPTNSTRIIRPQILSFNSTVPDQNATIVRPPQANATFNQRAVPNQNATFARPLQAGATFSQHDDYGLSDIETDMSTFDSYRHKFRPTFRSSANMPVRPIEVSQTSGYGYPLSPPLPMSGTFDLPRPRTVPNATVARPSPAALGGTYVAADESVDDYYGTSDGLPEFSGMETFDSYKHKFKPTYRSSAEMPVRPREVSQTSGPKFTYSPPYPISGTFDMPQSAPDRTFNQPRPQSVPSCQAEEAKVCPVLLNQPCCSCPDRISVDPAESEEAVCNDNTCGDLNEVEAGEPIDQDEAPAADATFSGQYGLPDNYISLSTSEWNPSDSEGFIDESNPFGQATFKAPRQHVAATETKRPFRIHDTYPPARVAQPQFGEHSLRPIQTPGFFMDNLAQMHSTLIDDRPANATFQRDEPVLLNSTFRNESPLNATFQRPQTSTSSNYYEDRPPGYNFQSEQAENVRPDLEGGTSNMKSCCCSK